MDGVTLLRNLRQILSETSTGTWLDTKSSYDFLYQAAVKTTERTNAITSTQTITTVADQSAYTLNGDFLKLYLMDDQNRYFIKYYNGSGTYWIYWASYDSIVLANNTTATSVPSVFSIRDASEISRLTGTVTSAGALSNGEATLTDSAAPFTNVYTGDQVHNTTDSANGIVIVKTSTSVLITAMFDGTDNDWDSSDAYIIMPQMRFQLVLDPPSSTSGHTITVHYVQKPAPVYSSFRSYKLDSRLKNALVNYAAWLYKYRDRNPNFGDTFYRIWDTEIRQFARQLNKTRGGPTFGVNFIKRSYGDRTIK